MIDDRLISIEVALRSAERALKDAMAAKKHFEAGVDPQVAGVGAEYYDFSLSILLLREAVKALRRIKNLTLAGTGDRERAENKRWRVANGIPMANDPDSSMESKNHSH